MKAIFALTASKVANACYRRYLCYRTAIVYLKDGLLGEQGTRTLTSNSLCYYLLTYLYLLGGREILENLLLNLRFIEQQEALRLARLIIDDLNPKTPEVHTYTLFYLTLQSLIHTLLRSYKVPQEFLNY